MFREVWRVLKPTGTCWLNLADSYHNLRTHNNGGAPTNTVHRGGARDGIEGFARANRNHRLPGLKEKDLIGIPWRVAFALQADGWYLRSDIVWAKPNPMPESVSDRPTKSHEYLFLLSKQATYYYDAAAILEPQSAGTFERYKIGECHPSVRKNGGSARQNPSFRASTPLAILPDACRNKRSVWTIATQAYEAAHFATFPEALIEPCVLAGCRRGGLCLDPFCGTATVGAVCERLDRRWVGVDLAYQDLAQARTAQRGLRFARHEATDRPLGVECAAEG